VLDGTADTLPKHGLVLNEKSHSRVHVLAPVPPGNDVEALRERVRDIMIAELKSMRQSQQAAPSA
jgi:1-acyl-sn-glycerol-3-phosphate acyltransferase